MSMIPVVIAQIPAKINSVYARTTKNCPLTQNASTVIMMPLIRVSHQRSLIGRSVKACTIHITPMSRNTKPRMSANPAKVAVGWIRATIPDAAEEHGEDRPDPPARPVNRSEDGLLGGEQQEQKSGEDSDGGDRSLVELQYHERDHDPEHARQELNPPIRGDLLGHRREAEAGANRHLAVGRPALVLGLPAPARRRVQTARVPCHAGNVTRSCSVCTTLPCLSVGLCVSGTSRPTRPPAAPSRAAARCRRRRRRRLRRAFRARAAPRRGGRAARGARRGCAGLPRRTR